VIGFLRREHSVLRIEDHLPPVRFKTTGAFLSSDGARMLTSPEYSVCASLRAQ
jgi:hypothetical protein